MSQEQHRYLDHQRLGDLYNKMGPRAAIIVDKYKENSAKLISQMQQALENGSATELGHHAHTLKGSNLTLGAILLADLCRSLEEQAHANNLSQAAALITQIKDTYDHTLIALDDFNTSLTSRSA